MSAPTREQWLDLAEQVHRTTSGLVRLGADIAETGATLEHIRFVLEVE